MKGVGFGGCALGAFAALAMLSGCGGRSGTPLNPSAAGVTPDGTRAAMYTVVYSFKGGSKDGRYPFAGVINVNGTLYGTTNVGGGRGCSYREGCGTVYRIKASGKEAVLHRFKGGPADGETPVAPLLNVNGTLYGTTASGGAYGNGTVFAITTSGMETVLYSFKGVPADGARPRAPLLNVNGTLYGTTVEGGAQSCSSYEGGGCGTVFSITPSGKETVLHSFKGAKTDGQNPDGGLIYVNGKLYGTTHGGGPNCFFGVGAVCGTVFSITSSGKERVLYFFKGGTTDGQNPDARLIYVKGKLYGTTTGAGAYNLGTVFATTPSGTETVLHSFGNGSDGAIPQAGLINVNGTLYGTTVGGGADSFCSRYYTGCGTVFSITTSGKETVRYRFKGGSTDGDSPQAGLINVSGTLYGTTAGGGSDYCPYSGPDQGCGTVFSLKP